WPWPDPINRILRTVIAVSSDLHPQHHSAILVLEVVAVKHPGLRPWKRMAKIDRDAHRFTWPDEDRVLRSDVGREAPGCIDGEPRQRVGARLPLENPELESMQVHRMRHARVIVAQQPDLGCISLHFDRRSAE